MAQRSETLLAILEGVAVSWWLWVIVVVVVVVVIVAIIERRGIRESIRRRRM